MPPQLAGWNLFAHEVIGTPHGETIFIVQLRRKEEFVTITSSIFSTTEQAAAKFLKVADSTTMMEIPYVQGPQSLGTLSAIGKNRKSDVFWLYRNIFSHVSRTDTEVSHFEIAACLQDQLERNKKLR